MGRLWQRLILSRWQPVLAYLPVETVIKQRQQAYYDQLAAADAKTACSGFIEFVLTAIEESLEEAVRAGSGQDTPGKTPGKTSGKTPERILGLLRDAPELSIPELAERLGKSARAVERAIRKLRESGRLVRVGPAKGGCCQRRRRRPCSAWRASRSRSGSRCRTRRSWRWPSTVRSRRTTRGSSPARGDAGVVDLDRGGGGAGGGGLRSARLPYR